MTNILTIFLIINVLITGTFWLFYKIKKINKYFKNKKTDKKNNLYLITETKLYKKSFFIQTLASFFPIFLIVFIVRSFIYEPFQIPSRSMMPTLLVGDFILVEKFSYGIKNPITQKILININKPKRGDIVVFKHPVNYNLNYIKRVIGLPGDKISYNKNSKHLKICANYIHKKNCTKKIFIYYSKNKLSNFVQKIYFYKKNYIENKKIYNSFYYNITQETINNLTHPILLLDYNLENKNSDYYYQKGMSKLTWVVPKNKYFMLGDNRDNSLDSRYWGFVPEKNLIGKATKIWMSFDKKEHQWPTGIRWNRIGNNIY